MLDRIGEEHLAALEAGFGQRRHQHLPGRADEGPARQVLLIAGLFAQQQDARAVARAFAGHPLGGLFPEFAATALVEGGGQRAFGLGALTAAISHSRPLWRPTASAWARRWAPARASLSSAGISGPSGRSFQKRAGMLPLRVRGLARAGLRC